MKTTLALVVLLALSAVAQSSTANVESAINSWKNSDTIFSPKLFKFLLMIPTTESEINDSMDKKVHSAVEQVNIKEETHPNDLVGSALKDFFNKGGSSSFAHVFSKFGDVKNSFSKWIMEVGEAKNKATPLTHGGQQITALKTSSLQGCLMKNNLNTKLNRFEGTVTLTISGNKLSFNEESFKPFETFLSDLCYLVEYSKLHYNDWRSGLLIHHLESFTQVASSEHRELFMTVLYNAIELLKKNIEKAYGENNIKFLVSKFVQAAAGSVPKLNGHSRILAEEADTGDEQPKKDTDADNQAYAHSIRLVFGICFLFLIMYTSVYLYRMEVYKDS